MQPGIGVPFSLAWDHLNNTLNSFANINNLEQLLRELINVTRDLGITVNVP